ncbi:amino acid permease [Aneurinibacillus migulanus]|uniref:amino acid permease n=1 Tax=Aneurinibacillus migulanus TaxID=47500 RepID=UPI0006960E61|nr:amino acid permease [Aneurinibacillus migulanus]
MGGSAVQLSTSRLLFAMGRDNVIPRKFFGYVHPRTGVPIFNVILSGVFSLSALFFDLETAISFFSFGAFTAFTFVNLSVIAYYIVKKRLHTPKAIILYLIFPIIALSFIGMLWYNMDSKALALGIMWNGIGFGYLLYLTKAFREKQPQFIFEDSSNG